MSIESTAGVVLRLRPLTETSLIVNWLTRDFGRIATVAKGARRPKSPFRGQIDLFYVADFSFSRSRRSDLHTLREARLLESNAGLRTDLGSLRQASYFAALIEQTTEQETPLPALFARFARLLRQLQNQPPNPQTVFGFEMKLLEDLGLNPKLGESRLTPGSRQILEKLLEMDWPAICQLRPSAAQENEIRQFLHGFLIYHIEKIPKGRNRALESDE
jgi:DNA repair protein RecO (recombination protein O)